MNQESFFTVGGALRFNAPSYVERPADDELLDQIMSGEFCYILTPRQMGKSSLMVRTDRRLQAQGIRTAVVDLTQIGSDQIKAEQWYLGLLTELQRKLKLSADPESWWQAHASLGRVQRFTDFLRNVILQEIEGQVVIFIDEIDATLQLAFTDDFFVAIRAMYNARANDPEFKRLTFVLLGVATPSDMIKDPTRTPFNIGYDIDLQEFSRTDAAVLQAGLEAAYPNQGDLILNRIFHWTGGHPYLTQKLCQATVDTENETWTEAQVDDLVHQLFLSEEARRETNLQFVRDGVKTSRNRRRLLKLYRQVYEGKAVTDDRRALDKNRLKLLGLVKPEHGLLKVRNEVYHRVFNLDWIKANTPRDWPRNVAIALVGIALLLAGIFGYLTYISSERIDASQAEIFIDNFRQTTSPDIRVTNLSNLFRIPGFEDRARELFFSEITFEEQIALFEGVDAQAFGDRLIIIVRGLYTHIDDNPTANQLLQVMAQTLHNIESDEATNLATEINQWLRGREYATRENFEYALSVYDTAIGLNSDNIGTRFDRALVYTELGQYNEALIDFDTVLEIVKRSPPTPTPTSVLTLTYTATPTKAPTASSSGNDSGPILESVEAIPTPAEAVSIRPSSPAQRFTGSQQIATQIEEKIRDNASLLAALSTNLSLYTNLAQVIDEFPAILTPSPLLASIDTPTLALTDAPISTPTSNVPTPSSTEITTPILTTPILASTDRLSPTPTLLPDAVVVSPDGVDLYAGPGTTYQVIDFLDNGAALDIQGRIANDAWIQVMPVSPGISGWAFAVPDLVQVNVDLNTIPIVEPPPLPTPIPISTVKPIEVDFQFEFGPKLFEPKPFTSLIIDEVVRFTWQEYPLQENQFYSFIVVRDDLTDENACIHWQTREPKVFLKFDDFGCIPGIYHWGVGIATMLPEGSEHIMWRDDSEKDQRSPFAIGIPYPKDVGP